MTTHDGASTAHRMQTQVERLAFFSDAVFAIAITLLVLEVKVPHLEQGASEHDLFQALLALVPKAVGFVGSFLVVGAYWATHHRLFQWVTSYDAGLLWRNLFLLLAVSWMPFPTAFFSEHSAARTPLVLYAGSLALLGVTQLLMIRYLDRRRSLLAVDMPARELQRSRRRTFAIPLVCVIAIVLAFVYLPGARLSLVLIPVAVRALDRSTAADEPLPA